MTQEEKIFAFFKECGSFFFASTEDGEPRVRPFGFKMLYEGRFYFGMGTFKPSYRQTIANPHVELCALKADGSFLRVRGKAVLDMREGVQAEMFKTSPSLRALYNEKNGRVQATFYLEDIDAQVYRDGEYTPLI